MNPFPADPEDGFIVRDDVPRCRARIAVPMIVEPLHGGSGAGGSVDQRVALLEFLLGPAAAGLHVEACARQQVSGQDLSLIHISEPTRLGMSSYAVFCLTK